MCGPAIPAPSTHTSLGAGDQESASERPWWRFSADKPGGAGITEERCQRHAELLTARFSVIDPHRMMQTCALTDGFVRTGIIASTYGQVSVSATRCESVNADQEGSVWSSCTLGDPLSRVPLAFFRQ